MKGNKKILVTGRDGQLGWELRRTLAPLGDVIALDRTALDLSSPTMIRRVVSEMRPHIIVNAAAYTSVDKAEAEIQLAKAVNADAAGILAEEAKKLKAILVHYSTDYIFDGTKASPYTETDTPAPLNAYGETKLMGERTIQEVGGDNLILRTSWVYGTRGRNFLLTMLKLARERDSLKVVGDQYGAPTWSRMIALATADILIAISKDRDENSKLFGTYHMTSGGSASWYEFAKAILECHKARHPDFTIPQLSKITTAEYPLPAKRPLNTILSNDKLKETFDIAIPNWHSALELCMDDM